MRNATSQEARGHVARMVMPLIGCLCVCLAGCTPVAAPLDSDTLVQTATMRTLTAGGLDGRATVGQMARLGDFGLGTFDGLDGEMVLLGGQVFQIRADGRVYAPPDEARTPFAAVTVFVPEQTRVARGPMSCAALEQFFDGWLPTAEAGYALRVAGTFESVKARSVPRQSPPYPPLSEVVEQQAIFDLAAVRGTMVGFRLPQSMGGVNSAGYHLHFITDDRTAGGHVLDCQVREVTIAADSIDRLVTLPAAAVENR